mmetsp:Transcript_37663/g.80199  ORF Transcript_37663/g.80199 Transcript_37663/m.80199 type:complete len:252 (-) Transcript_37663:714-1469(-)
MLRSSALQCVRVVRPRRSTLSVGCTAWICNRCSSGIRTQARYVPSVDILSEHRQPPEAQLHPRAAPSASCSRSQSCVRPHIAKCLMQGGSLTLLTSRAGQCFIQASGLPTHKIRSSFLTLVRTAKSSFDFHATHLQCRVCSTAARSNRRCRARANVPAAPSHMHCLVRSRVARCTSSTRISHVWATMVLAHSSSVSSSRTARRDRTTLSLGGRTVERIGFVCTLMMRLAGPQWLCSFAASAWARSSKWAPR